MVTWNTAAERLFGWTAAEAIGTPMRALIFPEEGAGRPRRAAPGSARTGRCAVVIQVEVELQRKDGTVFPAEETIHRLLVGDEVMLSAFIRDLTERRRRQQEREVLLGEQAARAEAERVAEMVSGMQLLVDAALAHRTTDDILPDLVSRVRGCSAPTGPRSTWPRATAWRCGRPRARRTEAVPTRRSLRRGLRRARGGHSRAHPEPETASPGPGLRDRARLAVGVPLLADDEVTGVLAGVRRRAAPLHRRRPGLLRLAADRVALGIDRARVYEREHRIAETLQRSLLPDRLPRAARARRWRRATSPPPRRPRWAATGTT